MMDTIHEETWAEEDDHEGQGDEGVDGHPLLHGPPDQAEVGSRAAISSAVDNGLAHQWQVLVHEKEQKHTLCANLQEEVKEVQKQKHLLLVEIQDGLLRRGDMLLDSHHGALLHFTCHGLHWFDLDLLMPNLGHEEFHEEEEGQEDKEKEVPNSHYRTAKTFFKTLNQARIGDVAMAPEIFMDGGPGHADHIHHHSIHSNEAKPQLPPDVVARFVTCHGV